MARAVRGFIDGGIYHILNRGNGRQTVFFKDGDYQAFMDLMNESRKVFDFKLYAYCIMPNHFHLVVECSKAETYSSWMQWLTGTYACRYHKHYGGNGHVWQGRFKSFLIQTDEYLLTVLRYVEANPVRAGMVDFADLWSWSSHNQRIGKISADLIDNPPIEMPLAWAEWVNRAIGDAELKAIRKSVNRQAPFGESSWQYKICQQLGMESVLRPCGRPKSKRGQTLF
jgi:putative transposase